MPAGRCSAGRCPAVDAPPVDAPPDAAADPAPEPPLDPNFEPQRLDAARTRLREQTPARPEDAPDESPPTPPSAAAEKSPPALPALVMDTRPPFTLAPIAERDPEEAGRLLLKLLPAQGIVHPLALAYDLVLDPATCVRVTVTEGGATEVNWMHTARAREDVRFRLDGDPASIIRLLTAGGLARRLRWRRLARIHGDRSGLAALGDLMAARLLAPELSGVGVRRDDLELDAQVEAPNRATSG